MSKKSEEEKVEEAIQKVIANYEHREKAFVNQLQIDIGSHPLTTGTYREEVWKNLFSQMIPKKYCIEQGIFIIDSKGHISREVDLAVFDEMYTPYIFKYGKIKFIPIEAVAIVVQCKSKINGGKRIEGDLEKWVKSIDELDTSLNSVVRTMNGVFDSLDEGNRLAQTGTRPIKILCATGITNPVIKKLEEKFDFLLYVKNKKLMKVVYEEKSSFTDWVEKLNHDVEEKSENLSDDREKKEQKIRNEKVEKRNEERKSDRNLCDLIIKDKNEKENVIMSLTFQLNQLLMLINNPMLFPHEAYVKLFNRLIGKKK